MALSRVAFRPWAPASSSNQVSTTAGLLFMARSTSSACTLPEPSQIALIGASRYSRARMKFSVTPLPPRHSIAS